MASSPLWLFVALDERLDRRAHDLRIGSTAGPGGLRRYRAERSAELLGAALGHATGTPPDAWTTGRAATGRPVVTGGPTGWRDVRISLAHSGPFMTAAVSAGTPVAVDLEMIRERRCAAIARYLDWPRHTWADGMTRDAFFHLWTLWEAAIKLSPADMSQAELFEGLARQARPGLPSLTTCGTRHARSWVCPDRFWMTGLAEGARSMSLWFFRRWPARGVTAPLQAIEGRRFPRLDA